MSTSLAFQPSRPDTNVDVHVALSNSLEYSGGIAMYLICTHVTLRNREAKHLTVGYYRVGRPRLDLPHRVAPHERRLRGALRIPRHHFLASDCSLYVATSSFLPTQSDTGSCRPQACTRELRPCPGAGQGCRSFCLLGLLDGSVVSKSRLQMLCLTIKRLTPRRLVPRNRAHLRQRRDSRQAGSRRHVELHVAPSPHGLSLFTARTR